MIDAIMLLCVMIITFGITTMIVTVCGAVIFTVFRAMFGSDEG